MRHPDAIEPNPDLLEFDVGILPAGEDADLIELGSSDHLMLLTEVGEVMIRLFKPESPEGPPTLSVTPCLDMLVDIEPAMGSEV